MQYYGGMSETVARHLAFTFTASCCHQTFSAGARDAQDLALVAPLRSGPHPQVVQLQHQVTISALVEGRRYSNRRCFRGSMCSMNHRDNLGTSTGRSPACQA